MAPLECELERKKDVTLHKLTKIQLGSDEKATLSACADVYEIPSFLHFLLCFTECHTTHFPQAEKKNR